MGWKVDDIVSATAGKYAKQFECSICFSIWDEPMETPCCQNVFCNRCISRCEACPMCRLPLGPLRPCSKAILRMLNNVEVRCPHHSTEEAGRGHDADAGPPPKRAKSRNSEQAGCAWVGTYGDLLLKHLGECPLHPIACPRECGEMVRRKDLALHEQTCAKSSEKCSICGELVKPQEMPRHRREAAELHVQLLEERLENEKERAGSAVEDRTALGDVLEKVKNTPKLIQQHITTITRQRSDEIKAEVRRQLNNSIVWRTEEPVRDLKAMARGQSLKSQPFFLCGSQFHLEFWPSGMANSDPPVDKLCSTLGLRGHSDRKWVIQFKVNKEENVDDDWGDTGYFMNWPITKLVFKELGPNEKLAIEVKVVSVADRVGSA